jgi:hypothetical protein
MRSLVTLVIVGLFGLLAAASIGYAAYVVSRDTVGTPVTKVKLSPNELAPPRADQKARPKPTTTRRVPPPPPPPPPTTTSESDDDSSGRGRGRGRGGDDDNSGRGGGDDD